MTSAAVLDLALAAAVGLARAAAVASLIVVAIALLGQVGMWVQRRHDYRRSQR